MTESSFQFPPSLLLSLSLFQFLSCPDSRYFDWGSDPAEESAEDAIFFRASASSPFASSFEAGFGEPADSESDSESEPESEVDEREKALFLAEEEVPGLHVSFTAGVGPVEFAVGVLLESWERPPGPVIVAGREMRPSDDVIALRLRSEAGSVRADFCISLLISAWGLWREVSIREERI